MKYTKLILFSLVLSLALASCKKDKDQPKQSDLYTGIYLVSSDCSHATYIIELFEDGDRLICNNFAQNFDSLEYQVSTNRFFTIDANPSIPNRTGDLANLSQVNGGFSEDGQTLNFSYYLEWVSSNYGNRCECTAFRQ